MNLKILLPICAFLTFTSFILTIIATSGSTSNYKPITNIFIGDADISKINVSKVVPQVGPILTVLGSALTAPNTTVDSIFGALKAIASTEALSPLLHLLANAADTATTLSSLTKLAPMALTGSSSASTAAFSALEELLDTSTNTTELLDGFSTLMSSISTNSSSTSLALENTVMNLLIDSINPVGTTEALITLNNMTTAEKTQLLPVFELFEASKNITATLGALGTIMNSTVSSSLVSTLFTTLESSLAKGANVTTTITQLGSMIPSSMQSAVQAVVIIFQETTSQNETMSVLKTMISENITESSSAKVAMSALTSLMDYTTNQTELLSSVASLATSTEAASSTNQLVALDEILSSSANASEVVSMIPALETQLANNTSLLQYVPYLFSLLSASSDPVVSFASLVNLTKWAETNAATFIPMLKILASAQSMTAITPEKFKEITPSILEYLQIPVVYRLSIFTMCRAHLNNTMYSCSKSHAVQNMDFRSIVYNNIEGSDFKPYMDALAIGKNDLHLDGELQDRQHMYVPAVKAALAMNLMCIITGFFLMVYFLLLSRRTVVDQKQWLILGFISFWECLFNGLGSTIFSVILNIMKSGTEKDNYGVVISGSSPFYGLMWSAFVLSILVFLFIACGWWNSRKAAEVVVTEKVNHESDSTSRIIEEHESVTDAEKNFAR
ncbi:YLR413W [Saccharomyces arboricola H-6]|uniref:YLR413W n=1 Tax=Saccharomyces arboricola (strain H-6 / AS 2.3317 / CBS 10644) TaxID=1160507 RepID=J8PKL5_SACAR|nr:YLR413W [Saccharomyces arboricola H-6]